MKGIYKPVRRLAAYILCLCVIFSCTSIISFAETNPTAINSDENFQNKDNGYKNYYEANKSAKRPENEIIVFDGSSTYVEEEVSQEWSFVVEEAGLYLLELKYSPKTENGNLIELELLLDGEFPFEESRSLIMPHRYSDEKSIPTTDVMGNDILSNQIESNEAISWTLVDNTGFIGGALSFMLEAGTHTLNITSIKEEFEIHSVRFYNNEKYKSYEEYSKDFSSIKTVGEIKVYEAEQTLNKTSTLLYPLVDRSSALTTPCDPISKKLNTIGGANWKTEDQVITWEIKVPEDGLYKIAFRYKQNFLRGFFVTRTLKIDDEIPFEEARDLRFNYSVRWQEKILGNDEDFLFYLKEGKHTISLTPTIGKLSETAYEANDVLVRMNNLYRRVVMVTGNSPDMFRDYYLQSAIPGLIDELNSCASDLRSIEENVSKLTGTKGSESVTLIRIAEQLEDFVENPDTIPLRISSFNDNIITLSTWVMNLQNQSLTLDKFWVAPSESKLNINNSNFFKTIIYHIKAFLGSFVADYESVGRSDFDTDKEVTVWISTGRDQADILKKLIDNDFVPKHKINVNMSLVQGGVMQAYMAGKAPDVVFNMGRSEPVNWALRGALLPIDDMEGFEELKKDYIPTAFTPYTLNGRVYAVPETLGFMAMFYRTDVFEEMDLTPPETWDDLLVVAEKLQRKHMNIGLPYASLDIYSTIFPTMLLQNGNGVYNENLTATLFDTSLAIETFKKWSDYYTQYDVPLFKDDFNRFRSGEMPIVITNYTFYNQLSVAAPEIRNLWDMTLIPGTKLENGEIDRTTATSGTACMILKSAKDVESAWELIKWYSSAETQSSYGIEIENVVGAAGRYNPANIKALERIPWGSKQIKTIKGQLQDLVDMPEIAGGYYVSRNVDNAFNSVYYNGENYREALTYWNKQINREIERKRKEFGLE